MIVRVGCVDPPRWPGFEIGRLGGLGIRATVVRSICLAESLGTRYQRRKP